MTAEGASKAKEIDAAVRAWRQGDLALGTNMFMHVCDLSAPLTPAAEAEAANGDSGVTTVTSEVVGLAVVTQTCDIVRTCVERPFVEASPLVKLSAEDFHPVRRGNAPRYVLVPSQAQDRVVVDLDRVMTLEKSVVASWARTPGLNGDAEVRRFLDALARKRKRPAFPEDFVRFARVLCERIRGKHDKRSPEGQFLRELREIRVRPEEGWIAAEITLIFRFILNENHGIGSDLATGGKTLGRWAEEFAVLVPPDGRFRSVELQVVGLEDLTALDYVHSDRLDLDYLSSDSDAA